MPYQLDGLKCGPQVPGTQKPTNGSKLAGLNPCPLNACCDDWGFCGTTARFCTVSKSETGAPGTRAAGPDSNGCISNCVTDIVNNKQGPSKVTRIGYFEGWNFNRQCLYMDVEDINISMYSHIHFAFAFITPGDWKIDFDSYSKDQFSRFTQLSPIKKVISFGGWAFS